jgi:DNA polymerase III alpha subunit (gram-positive type)
MKNDDFRNKKLVFIDIETTGLSLINSEIIELAAIVCDGISLDIEKTFHSRIKPLHMERAEKEALLVNGYDPIKWRDARDLKDTLIEFGNLAPNGLLVGWNVSFDWAFLEKAFEENQIIHKFDYHKIDAMSVAYAELFKKGAFASISLRKVAVTFNVKLPAVHDAANDTRATYEIFKKIMNEHKTQGTLGI